MLAASTPDMSKLSNGMLTKMAGPELSRTAISDLQLLNKRQKKWCLRPPGLKQSRSEVADAKIDSFLLKCIDGIIYLKMTKLRLESEAISKSNSRAWFSLPERWISWKPQNNVNKVGQSTDK